MVFPDEILIDKDNEKFFVILSSENNKKCSFQGAAAGAAAPLFYSRKAVFSYANDISMVRRRQ